MTGVQMSERTRPSEPATASRFAELYATHATPALRLAYLLTGDRDQAEDLMQDAFVRVGGSFAHVRTPETFWPYLRRTIVNAHNSRLRRLRLERAYLRRSGAPSSVAAPEDDPDVRADLWAALRRLPARQRAAIVLRYYEDLSEADSAEILHCSKSALKSLIARGSKTLRAEIGGSR